MDILLIANIVYGVSIGLMAIGVIFGIVKGFWKTTFALGIQLLLLLITVAIAPSVGKALGNIDLAGFTSQTHFEVAGTLVKISSARQTICDALTASGLVSPMQGQTIYQAALALTDMGLSLAAYLALAVASALLGWLLAALLYHTIAKWLVPKRFRLRHKLRLTGSIAGAAVGLMAATIAIAPFSSLAKFVRQSETVIQRSRGKLGAGSENVLGYLEAFGTSAYGSGWLGDLDDWLMSGATSVWFNGVRMDLPDLTGLIQGLGLPFANALKEGGAKDRFDYTLLMEPNASINIILDAMIGSNLIVGIMPAMADAAVNYYGGQQSFDLSKLSFEDIDFKGELASIKEIYGQLYSTGLIDQILGGKPVSFTYADKDKIVKALGDFGRLESINNNMPALAALSAQSIAQATGYRIISTDPQAYIGIDWSKELTNVGNAVFDLAKVAGVDVSFDSVKNLYSTIYSQLGDREKAKEVKKILVGNDYDNDTGSLFDTDLISPTRVDFAQVTNLLFGMVPTLSDYIDRGEFSRVLATVGSSKRAIKNEVGTTIDMLPDLKVIADVSNENTGSYFDLDVDLRNDKQREALINVIGKAANSQLIGKILPNALGKSFPEILEKTFNQSSFLGLSASSFDFSYDAQFFADVQAFLRITPAVLNIYESLNAEKSTAEKIKGLKLPEVRQILETVISSKVFNPVHHDEAGTEYRNTNVNTLVRNIFTKMDLAKYGLEVATDLDYIDWSRWINGQISYPEVDKLMEVLQVLQENADLLKDDKLDTDKLTGEIVSELVDKTSRSQLLGPTLPNLFEKQIRTSLEGLNINFDFYGVKDWTKAADAMGSMYDLAKPILKEVKDAENKPSVTNIWKTFNGDYLNALFTELERTGALPSKKCNSEGRYSDHIGDFMYYVFAQSQILPSVSDTAQRYDFYSIHPDDGSLKGWQWANGEPDCRKVTLKDGATPIEAHFTASGEIYNLFNTFDQIKADIDAALSGTASRETLKKVFIAMDQSELFRIYVAPAIDKRLAAMPSLIINGNEINTSAAAVDMLNRGIDETTRKQEYEMISWLYEYGRKQDVEGQRISALDDLFGKDKDGKYNLAKLNEKSPVIPEKTRLEIVEDVLKKLTQSAVFSTKRINANQSVRNSVFTVFYSLIKLDQMSYGYGPTEDCEDKKLAIWKAINLQLENMSADDFTDPQTGENQIIIKFLQTFAFWDNFPELPTGGIDLIKFIPFLLAIKNSHVVSRAYDTILGLINKKYEPSLCAYMAGQQWGLAGCPWRA